MSHGVYTLWLFYIAEKCSYWNRTPDSNKKETNASE